MDFSDAGDKETKSANFLAGKEIILFLKLFLNRFSNHNYFLDLRFGSHFRLKFQIELTFTQITDYQ